VFRGNGVGFERAKSIYWKTNSFRKENMEKLCLRRPRIKFIIR
jgi:hypothetical protein